MKYEIIYKNYEQQFQQHGNSFKGVGWPREEDCHKRFNVLAGLFSSTEVPVTVLDFGCGLSHFYEYLMEQKWKGKVDYLGLDISNQYIDSSKNKFPHNQYYCQNILEEPIDFDYDYVIINGVFTQKFSMTHSEMFSFVKLVLTELYRGCSHGIAFNLMSDYVDFKRDGAFHLSFGAIADFIVAELTNNFVIRHDYGLYEYTVYILKQDKI